MTPAASEKSMGALSGSYTKASGGTAFYGVSGAAALRAELAAMGDSKYREFHSGLVPGTAIAYGIPVPLLRKLATRILKEEPRRFLSDCPPASYEETLLRGLVIAGLKADWEEKLLLIADFLPLIDNWAVCDTFCTALRLKKPEEQEKMLSFLLPLLSDDRTFFVRFAVVTLLAHYVTENYADHVLSLLQTVTHEGYYVQMAVAWAISICYIKFPKKTLPLLQKKSLSPFVQNKSIQKIRESLRVTREDKELLVQYKLSL